MRHLFTRILAAGLLAGSLAAAATFNFELKNKAQAGQTQLQPGKYSLAIDGSTAVLKDKAGKTVDVKAKVEQRADKSAITLLGFSSEPGPKKLTSVYLGGTNIRVTFD
jgi:hypothetical protein